MLRSWHRRTPWTASEYVCRSCRHQIQSARRFQSTAVSQTDDGRGEDDWYSNFNDFSVKSDRDTSVMKEKKQEQKEKQKEVKVRHCTTSKEPRRQYPSDHPEVKQFSRWSLERLKERLDQYQGELEVKTQARDDHASGKPTEEAIARTTAFAGTVSASQRRSLSEIRSMIELLESLIDLKQQGRLDESPRSSEPSAGVVTSSGSDTKCPNYPHSAGEPRTRYVAPGHGGLKGLHGLSTARLERRLQQLKSILGQHLHFARSNASSGTPAQDAAPAVATHKTAFTRTPSGSRRSVADVRSNMGLVERILELRRDGVLKEPTEPEEEKEALEREVKALRQAFGNIKPPRLRSTSNPSELRHNIAFLRRALQAKKDADASMPGDDSQETSSQPDATSPSAITGLDSIVAKLRQEFKGQVEYANNVSGGDAAEEPQSRHASTDRKSSLSNRKSVQVEKASGLDDLRQRLQRETQAKQDVEPVATTAKPEDEHFRIVEEEVAAVDEPPSRISMPRFAATSDAPSTIFPTKPGAKPNIAQRVREARDSPKWGLGLADSSRDQTAQARLRRREKEERSLAQKLKTEEVIPFSSADSPADLAELQVAPPAPPPQLASAKSETTETVKPDTADESKHAIAKVSQKRETARIRQQKPRSLEDLKRDLNLANQKGNSISTKGARAMSMQAIERTEDNARMQAVERNVQDYQPMSAAPSATCDDHDASASLANLHRSERPKGQDAKAAPPMDKKPEAVQSDREPTEAPKPAKTGGRKKPRARTERKKTSTPAATSKASDIGGDDGDNGEHKPLWRVMQSSESASASAEDVKPTQKEEAPMELPDNGPPTIDSVKAGDLHIDALKIPQPPVPGLEYGLDRVLFNPGVYQLQDPTSRVYNFDPYLQDIMPAVEFDFNALKEYKTSSEDKALSAIAKEHQKRYLGSTSSMTSTLAHFHYLLSNWRPLNLEMLSRGFTDQADEFTRINRAPNAIFLRWKPESKTYAIDADKEFDGANVLMMLGKSMEKMLTLPTSDFEKYRKSDPRDVPAEARDEPEAFEYTTMGDFLMRSQLDAYDSRLPGNGMFDLKTRAVLSIRMDAEEFQPMLGYEIHTLQGRWNSYEREYYDMMRSTMLKYMLQARMGRMQGIFAAYHNIERIFGFQYIPMMDMDRALHGQIDSCLGDQEFKLSLELLNKVLDKATARFPEKSLRFHFETTQQNLGGDSPTPVMSVFAEPMEEKEIKRIQSLSKEKVREFERNVMGVEDREAQPATKQAVAGSQASGDQEPIEYPPATPEPPSEESESHEPASEEDTPPTTYPPATPEPDSKEAAASATEFGDQAPTEYSPATPEPSSDETENGESKPDDSPPTTYPPVTPEPPSSSASSSDVNSSSSAADSDFLSSLSSSGSVATSGSSSFRSSSSSPHLTPLFAATLMAKSRVNGEHVTRPSLLKRDDDWTVEYLLTEYPESEVTWAKYAAVKGRRKEVLVKERDEGEDVSPGQNGEAGEKKEKKRDYYIEFLQEKARRGREFRKEMNKAEKGREKKFVSQELASGSSAAGQPVEAEVANVGGYMGWLYRERGRKV